MIIDDLFERKVLAALLRVNEFNAVAAQHLKPSHFEDVVRHNIARMVIEFREKYDCLLTVESFARKLAELLKSKTVGEEDIPAYSDTLKDLIKVDCSDWRYTLDQLLTFIKNREIRRHIEQCVKTWLPKNDFKAIEEDMARIGAISAETVVKPYDYWLDESIDERFGRREIEVHEMEHGRPTGIPTGISAMDKVLYKGGWYRRELYILMAPPKTGKTMALLYHGNFASKAGYHVALFSCETGREVLSDRLDAQNAMIETKLVRDKRHYISKILKARGEYGKLFLLEYPTKTLTLGELSRQISRIESGHGIKLGLVVVDYGDILKAPRSIKDNPLREQSEIFEGLRRIAGELDVAMLTATQTNRSGTGKAVTDGTDTSGTYEKIMVADGVITLSGTREEVKNGKLRINFSESRNNPRATILISTKYNYGQFFGEVEDVE